MGDREQESEAGHTSRIQINPGSFLRCLSVVAWKEVRQLFLLAGPLILSQVMIYSLNFISSAFSGHLGKYELGAVSLATSVISVTGVAVGTGLSMACDTLISQTYGSKKLRQIGVILQRGILILIIFCCPCWALFINTEKILLATKQHPEVARGSAWANVISQYSQNIILFTYIHCRKLHLPTWGGWTMDCLQEWGPFLRLAIPSMFMFCIELWAYEMGSFLAGLISQVELGAQSIIFQVLTVLYMTHVGIGMAAGVHVGMALGGGDPQQAKISAMTAIICAGCVALFLMTLLLGLKDLVAKIFTSDRQIVDLVSRTIPIVAPVHLSDAIGSGVASGIVRGAGKQKIGAVANLVVFYIVGIPVGISLMFTAKLGILGLWTGLALGTFLLSSLLLTLLFRMNWATAAQEAQERTGLRKGTGPSRIASGFDLVEDGASTLSQGQEEPYQLEHTVLIASNPAVGILSPVQLLIRRGLAVVAGLVVLAVGITFHFTV
ncbi:multidrug and toxin extrusion protein 2-like isoform X4 [Chiloscyllium punctatum]|uniref:multidrug and toxin extrusion protein 2-like isoform X4 n=1 Tax=Chiloscyllium punctatum TaxID=137246 RepID=UPI003B63829B